MKAPRLGIAAALLLALGLLLLVSASVGGVFVDRMVARTLTRQAIAEVQGRAVAVARDLIAEQRASTGRSLSEDLADIATGTTYALLTDARGRFELSKGPAPPTMPAGGWAAGPPQGWFSYGGVPYVYASQDVPVEGAVWRLIVVRREAGLSRVMLVLGRILLLGGALLALMLLVGVLTAVRAITRPLDALRAFAERVAGASGEAGPAPPADSGLSEVDALAGAFREMLARLEAGRERERQFASDVAHALRTPLQVISGYLTTLPRRGQEDEALRRQALATLRREVAGMGALIQRLLTLSQVSIDAPLALAPVDVDALLQETLPALRDSCPEHELVLRAGAAARACGDAALLAEGVRILVENADAYATSGGTVRVETASGGDWVEVAVTNPGPPLSAEVVPHLFERFQRGGRPAASGHVGLGLAIADRLVRRMGGAWRIDSAGGEVTFALRLLREGGGVE